MNRSQLKAKAYRRAVRGGFRRRYGKDMYLEFYLNWLRVKRGNI